MKKDRNKIKYERHELRDCNNAILNVESLSTNYLKLLRLVTVHLTSAIRHTVVYHEHILRAANAVINLAQIDPSAEETKYTRISLFAISSIRKYLHIFASAIYAMNCSRRQKQHFTIGFYENDSNSDFIDFLKINVNSNIMTSIIAFTNIFLFTF